MKKRALLLAGLVVLLVAGAWTTSRVLGDEPKTRRPAARKIGPGFSDALAKSKARGASIPWLSPSHSDGTVIIAGTVIDVRTAEPVGNVEVVFRTAAGEESTTAGADGKYRLELPAGVYRAFVRDDSVLSVGRLDLVRVPGMPAADTAGVPDEALMPLVVATSDADGVDLSVMRGGVIKGRVVDRAGQPIAEAVLRAHGHVLRPTLGTDIAETDHAGTFEMQVPAGEYQLEASHPRFAGVYQGAHVSVDTGDTVRIDVTLTAGCVVSGKVIGHNGHPANEGAIEKQWGETDVQFAPSSRINSDGTFRWVTTEETEVVLRAWPWKAPPSPSKRFTCRDGVRHTNVVFALPDRGPDIEGVLLDDQGAPVAFAHIDLAPLDPGGIAQQERTDADGKWGVFQMPAGRYSVTAYAPSRGIVSTTVSSPQRGVRLALSGTGRLEGTTTLLGNGSFELLLGACLDGATVPLPRDQRLVTVIDGRFSVDDVPACDLQAVAVWHGQPVPVRATVPRGGAGRVELAIGPPRVKIVRGTVRDRDGRPVQGVIVIASGSHGTVSATTDGTGRYTLETISGASLAANERQSHRMGYADVGMANVAEETVDITLSDNDSHHEPPSVDDLDDVDEPDDTDDADDVH